MRYRSSDRRASVGRRRFFRKLVVTATTFVLTTSIVVAIPLSAGVARADAASDAITEGLGQLADALTGLDGLDELGDLVPFTDILPTGGDGLDLVDAFTEMLQDQLLGAVDAAQVESRLNALDGTTLPGTSIVVNVGVSIATDGSDHIATFTDLRLSRTHVAELVVDNEDIALTGLALSADFALTAATSTGPLALTITEGVPPSLAISAADAPPISLSVVASADLNPGLSATLGIGQVTLAGGNPTGPDVVVSAGFTASWLDPDSDGSITGTELITTAPLDLFDVGWAPSTATLDLEVTSDLIPDVTGTVTLNDTDLGAGLDVPEVLLGAVGNLSNLTPQDAILAIAQIALSLDAVQLQLANPGVPFLDRGLAQLVSVNEKLEKFFADQGLVVAGGGPYDFDFTLDDLKAAGLDTIEGIIAALESSLLAGAGGLGLTHADGALLFTINRAYGSGDTTAPTLALDLGSQLSDVGIVGLSEASASITADPTFELSFTAGIDIGSSPILTDGDGTPTGVVPITDRVFIETSTVNEIRASMPVTANLDLRGHIGLLDLSLVTCDDPGETPTCDTTADDVTLLAAAGAGDMLEIDLDGGADDKITVTELFDALSAPGGVTLNAAATPPTATITSGDNTLTAKLNVAVPHVNLNADASVGSTSLADGTVAFELANILDPSGLSVTATDFDAFSAFDTDDPEAFFALVVNAVAELLQELDGLDGDALDFDIPIVEVNFGELTSFFGDLATELQALIATPAGGLGSLEALLELKIFEVLQGAGFIDSSIAVPEIPDSEDFADLAAYEAALTAFLQTTLPSFLSANANFLTLSYEPGTGGAADALLLELSFDEDQTVNRPFNLNLAQLGAGSLSSVLGAAAAGDVELRYGVDAGLTVGLELNGLSSPPRPFLVDSSHVTVWADGGLSGGEFEASVGPFAVRIGEATGTAESGTQCENAVDDDGDGIVNDGCPEVGGDSETGDQCLNDTDDDDDSAENDEVNDGCPSDFGATAGFRASFDVSNDLDDDPATDERVYFSGAGTQIGTWAGGIADRFDFTSTDSGLGGGPDDTTRCLDLDTTQPAVCADLPFFLDAGGTTIFLDEVELALVGLDPSGWTLPNFANLIQAIEDNAEELALALLLEGVQAFLVFLEGSLGAAAYDVNIPVIGDALDAGADIVGKFNTGVVTPIGDAIAAAEGLNSDALDTLFTNELTGVLGPGDIDILKNAFPDDIVQIDCGAALAPCSLLDVEAIDVRLELGQSAQVFDVPLEFDFAVPGLRLDMGDATLSSEGSWGLDVGFGLSRTEGFYILTSDTDMSVEADLNLNFGPDPIVGDIAFIQLEVTDGKPSPDDPEASLTFVLDVTGGGGKLGLSELLSGPDPLGFDPSIQPVVDLDFDIQTMFDVGDDPSNAIPKLLATLKVGWTPADILDALELDAFSADFEDVQLDVGSFVAEFLGPVLEDIDRYLKPIRPVIDTISAPVPGVAQLAELVGEEPPTLLDLFESISGNDLTFIRRIIELIDFIGAVTDIAANVTPDGTCSLCIPIGEFSLDGEQLFAPALPATGRNELIDPDSIILTTANVLEAIDDRDPADFGSGGSGFQSAFSSSRTGGGFSFPAFENPSQLFELIVGGNPTLVEWRSGVLQASFGFSQSFGPIFVGPIPISIVISGSAGVEGQFGIGYDTKGIRQLVEILTDDNPGNDSFYGGVSALLAGVFIDDLDENGNDVPEIAFFAEIAAGAALDLVIVSAGVEGGVRAEITLNLHDGGYANPPPPENLDGKLRIDEIVSFVDNPLCIFDVGGKLTAFLRAFVEVDLFLFSKKFAFTIVNVTLLEFENLFADACEPAAPEPATKVGTVLRLNMGPFAGFRNFASGETEERFVLRQIDADSVSVTAFGITKDYHGVTKVFAHGGTDDDVIILETGVTPENSGEIDPATGEEIIDNGAAQQQDFVLPSVLCGGSGNDRILGGYGNDRMYGDGDGDNDDTFNVNSSSCPDTDGSNDGNDTLTGNAGADRAFGQGGNDIITGDAGDDPELRGGDGEDEVVGGAGRDKIWGDDGNDVLLGGPEPEPTGTEADDEIHGGDGEDTIEGDWGDDDLFGDEEVDDIIGNQGDDDIDGGDGADRILGNEGDDDIAGNAGDDEIQGNEGDDDIYGDDRDPASTATGRDDIVAGAGEDDVWGGPGEDLILGDEGEIFRDQLAIAADPSAGPFDPPDDETPLFMFAAGNPYNDTLNGGDDADKIYGQGGNDTINGDGGDDDLHGNDGIDTMSGNAGADTMFGDAGNDQMYGDSASPVPADDGADTMRGGNDDDTMRGNAAGDSIFGDSGKDTIYGDAETPDAANDGVDTVRGGPDEDLIYGNAAGDFLFGDGSADRIIGGSSQDGEPDGADTMSGGAGPDVMIGDNGTIGAGGTDPDDIVLKLVTLRLDDQGAGDTMLGDGDGDRMFGQAFDDTMSGNDGDDYMEGNAGSDDMWGDAGEDDMIGGSSADDGVIDADRVGTGRSDTGDEMWGGAGADWMAGDNARIERNFDHGSADDLVLFDVDSNGATSGGDYMYGGGDGDVMFGQGNGGQPASEADPPDGFDNDLDGAVDEDGPLDMSAGNPWQGDALFGEGDTDYIEGNAGSDYLVGGASDDDLIGGGSANDGSNTGVIDADRNGTGLDDKRDTIHGEGGVDWIAGDNARFTRVFDRGSTDQIVLFDVNSADTTASAGDYLRGGPANDAMFGQGNGDQGNQRDPLDGGVDNDLDNDVEGPDEDQPWAGDVMFGDAGDDYMEGNHGADLMYGDAGDGSVGGDDDMVGGGSANDGAGTFTGTFTPSRSGDDLADSTDVMYGEGGVDWMAGDNSFIERNAPFLGDNADFVMFDVNSDNQAASGGDFMHGGPDDDFMVGQGNGDQGAQADPRDGVDTDADDGAPGGGVDEDQPWDGDVMLGGADDDYMEGNHGADVMWGDDGDGDGTDGDGEDDMIGGGSALNGVLVLDGAVIDTSRDGSGLRDEGDVMRGEGAEDFMAGDNARIDRTGALTGLTLARDRSVQLFDVETVGGPAVTAFSGGDWMSGGTEADVMFGQGNGSQPADEADPLDGVDNDFDGREDGDPFDVDDQGWDCDDGGLEPFDNDGDGDADADDADCAAAIDEDQPWSGDVMFGNAGDDYMEGNHGADWMFGDDGDAADAPSDGEDDMIGGGSANDGAIVPSRLGTGLEDGPDVMHGEGEDDVMAGDNARINRVLDSGAWAVLDIADVANPTAGFAPYQQTVRITDMFAGDAGADAHGNDYMTGGIGQDEMYGQLGDDFVLGNEGDDVLVGDLGQVRANLLGDGVGTDPAQEVIETASPRWEDTIYEVGSMLWETELYAYDTSSGGVGGNDILLGYDGRDTAFGGPGDDVINGDGDGTEEFLDAVNPEYSHITDVVPETVDEDMLFGGDDNDAIWGGRHNDVMYGGHGADFLDVRPREETDNGRHGANFRIIPRDPPLWFAFAFPENLQDVDFMYGGWDADALQADQAANGPDPGDRMADWAGGYNVFYLCPAGYGDFTITRSGSPFVRGYLQDLAEASGAFMAAQNGESGFRDVGFVFPNQRGQNSHPPHPDHPGHFTCVDYTGVGNGTTQASAGGPYSMTEGGSVHLDASASTGEGEVSFEWFADALSFDDGASATPVATATSMDDGVERVLLEVGDGEGGFDLQWFEVTIENAAPTVDDPSTHSLFGAATDLVVGFADPGTLDTHAAVIDWGDGTTCDTGDPAAACSVDPAGRVVVGSHVYAAPGSYAASVTVTDDDGASATATGTIEVAVGVDTADAWMATDAWPLDPVSVAGVDYARDEAIAAMSLASETERSAALFVEVVAASLNGASGADGACVADLLVASHAWLANNPPGSGLEHNDKPWKDEGADLWAALVDYNAGLMCAPAG